MIVFIVAVLVVNAKEPDIAELGAEPQQIQLQTLQIAPEENSYSSISKLGINITPAEQKILDEYVASEDITAVQPILDRYASSMDSFYRLAKLPHFADPNYMVPDEINVNTPVPTYIDIRDIGFLNSVMIRKFASEGKYAVALGKSDSMLAFSEKARADNPSLVLVLVANLVDRYTLQALGDVTVKGEIPSSSLITMVATMDNKYGKSDKALSDAFKSEHTVIKNMNRIIESGERSAIVEAQKSTEAVSGIKGRSDPAAYETRFYASFLGTERAPAAVTNKLRYLVFERGLLYKPNRTKENLRKDYEEMIDLINNPCKEIPGIAASFESRLPGPEIPLTESNRYGALFSIRAYPTFIGAMDRNCDRELDVASTSLALALQAYKQDNGEFPLALDELVPKYINNIPDDPYSHKPLTYSPEEKTIISMRDPENEADEFRFDLMTMQSNIPKD